MASLGTLVVNLGANTAPLTAGLAKSQRLLSGFASSAKSALLPLAGAAAVGAGAVYALTERIGTLAGIADKATQTGLSGKFLMQLQFAADQSGVSVDTLTGSIGKMTIAVGRNSEVFAKLGIDLVSLKAMNPEQQFLSVAAAISKLPTAADRAAAAVSIFGKTGLEMTGLFAGGMSDLNALMAEAERLGLGISDEALAKAAAADDALQKMKFTFGAILDQVTIAVAPAMESLADRVSKLLPPMIKFLDEWNKLPNAVQKASDITETVFRGLFAAIRLGWHDMTTEIVKEWTDSVTKFLPKHLQMIAPIGLGLGEQVFGGDRAAIVRDLENAKAEIRALMPQGGGAGAAAGPVNNKIGFIGAPKMQGFAAGVLANIQAERMAGFKDIADAIAPKAQSLLGILGGVGSAVAGNVAGMFPGAKPLEEMAAAGGGNPRAAGAMLKGSQEAFSTILANVNGSKDKQETLLQKLIVATNKNGDKIAKAVGAKPVVVEDF